MNTEEIQIRRVWNPETKQWNYSIVDTIDFVIQTRDARNYWKVLKNRLKKRDSHIPYKCNQLKMKSRDGKQYLTDVTDAKYILEISSMITDLSPIALEVWIKSVERTKPDKKLQKGAKSRRSYPQSKKDSARESSFRSLRNRLKRFFSF